MHRHGLLSRSYHPPFYPFLVIVTTTLDVSTYTQVYLRIYLKTVYCVSSLPPNLRLMSPKGNHSNGNRTEH